MSLSEIPALYWFARLQEFTGAGGNVNDDLLSSNFHLRVDCRCLVGLDPDRSDRESFEASGFHHDFIDPQIDRIEAVDSGVVGSGYSSFIGGKFSEFDVSTTDDSAVLIDNGSGDRAAACLC